MVSARDIMSTAVLTLSPEQRIRAAAEALRRRCVSAAPVCDARGHVVGMLSKDAIADVLYVAPQAIDDRVRDHMSRDVLRVRPESDVEVVARTLALECAHFAVVVEPDGTPLGVVTPLDVLAAVLAAGQFAALPPGAPHAHFPPPPWQR